MPLTGTDKERVSWISSEKQVRNRSLFAQLAAHLPPAFPLVRLLLGLVSLNLPLILACSCWLCVQPTQFTMYVNDNVFAIFRAYSEEGPFHLTSPVSSSGSCVTVGVRCRCLAASI